MHRDAPVQKEALHTVALHTLVFKIGVAAECCAPGMRMFRRTQYEGWSCRDACLVNVRLMQ